MMTEVRGASNAKAKRELGLAAAAPELARGLRRGRRPHERGGTSERCSTSCARRPFAIAYRMLGSVAEAEDVVQEALLRVHRALEEGERIESPRAYLATVATRLAIDELRSARARRETLRRRVAARAARDRRRRRPGAARRDGRLAVAGVPRAAREPVARAARRVPAARRVRLRLRRDRRDRRQERGQRAPARGPRAAPRRGAAGRASRPRASSATSSRGASSPPLRRATSSGLEALLADDVVLHGDGGGKVPALARSLHGAQPRRADAAAPGQAGARMAGVAMRRVEVNGQPGRARARRRAAADRRDGARHRATARCRRVRSVVNPDKLAHLGPVADLRALLRPQPGE